MSGPKIDPVSLRLYLYVIELGTLAGAADRIHIVKSAASKRIAELESAFDAQLLRRTNRGVEPTAAGAALVNYARAALSEFDSLPTRMRDFSKGVRGHVRMLASMSAICQFLPGDLASFGLAHPRIRVHFEEKDSATMLKTLAENGADIGVSVATDHAYELQEIPYHHYALAVLVPRSHVLAKRRGARFAEVLDHAHIGLRAGGATNTFLTRAAAELHRTIDFRMYVDSYDALVLMVDAGLGVGVVPRRILANYSDSLRVRAIALQETWASRELRIYLRQDERLPTATKMLAEHLRQAAAQSRHAQSAGEIHGALRH